MSSCGPIPHLERQARKRHALSRSVLISLFSPGGHPSRRSARPPTAANLIVPLRTICPLGQNGQRQAQTSHFLLAVTCNVPNSLSLIYTPLLPGNRSQVYTCDFLLLVSGTLCNTWTTLLHKKEEDIIIFRGLLTWLITLFKWSKINTPPLKKI